MKEEEIRSAVRERYSEIARQESSCCCEPEDGCCGSADGCCGSVDLAEDISKKIGYTEDDLGAVPEGANLGLGCGNPVAFAALQEGDTVLDLGSGAGFDCFIAAGQVGQSGRVIGVDMTPDMVSKARANASRGEYGNVEFRLGEIENLPVADGTVDAVLSNCVINLAPDKGRVFREAFRTLKPGGRLMVSDIVLIRELPEAVKNSVQAYTGCLAGALLKDAYVGAIEAAGFEEIEIVDETSFPLDCITSDPTAAAISGDLELAPAEIEATADAIRSIKVCGVKPDGK